MHQAEVTWQVMEEELKKLIESTTAETRRHFDVVAERLESKIGVVGDGVIAGHQRTDRLDGTNFATLDDCF